MFQIKSNGMAKSSDIIFFLKKIHRMEYHRTFILSQLNSSIGLRNLRRFLKCWKKQHSSYAWIEAAEVAALLYYVVKEGKMAADKEFFDYAVAILQQLLDPYQYRYDMRKFLNDVVDKMNSFSSLDYFSLGDMYFDDDTFYLPWEYITFFDGFVTLKHPKHLSEVFVYSTELSIEEYNTIDKSFFEKLAPIYVKSEGGKIVEVLGFVELNKYLNVLKIKLNEPSLCFDDIIIRALHSGTITSFVTPHTRKFGPLDSFYLLKLEEMTNGPHYVCDELRTTYSSSTIEREKAYLFIHTGTTGNHVMVFENVNVDNSTLIFHVEKESYEQALEAIAGYFNSYKCNKRENLIKYYNIFRNYGVISNRRIMHTYQTDWYYSIIGELKSANFK